MGSARDYRIGGNAQQATSGQQLDKGQLDSSSDVKDDHWAVWSCLVAIACTALMFVEFYENAMNVDFEQPLTDDCYFRWTFLDFNFCAANFKTNPVFGPTAEVLLHMGAVSGERIVDDGQVWRLATGIFLHGGAVHCAVNMLALLAVSRPLERVHGCVRVACVFMLAGIFGAIASATFAPFVVGVGASGAIFGLIGATLGDVLMNWELQLAPCRALRRILFSVVLMLLLGTLPYLDNFAHLFGFAMGFASSFLVLKWMSRPKHCLVTCSRRAIQLVAAAVVLGALAIGIGVLYGVRGADANELCPECARISCSPFPWGCEGDSCWWTCESEEVNRESSQPECIGEASYVGSEENGTVELRCANETLVVFHPIDVSDANLTELCTEHCNN